MIVIPVIISGKITSTEKNKRKFITWPNKFNDIKKKFLSWYKSIKYKFVKNVAFIKNVYKQFYIINEGFINEIKIIINTYYVNGK